MYTCPTHHIFYGKITILLCAAMLAACASAPKAERGRGLLRLEVTPDHAEVLIDAKYQGQVRGWREQTVPVRAGMRRVTLRAEGYITQRFDLELAPNEEVTLSVALEPALDEPVEATDDPRS
jgi:hypothetical protein